MCASAAAQTTSVLFVGNSYTYVNDLPQTLAEIALSKGDTLIFDSSAPGGYTFQQHSAYAPTLSKINLRAWNYVVLQEQSQLPSFSPAQVASSVFPYARKLDSLVLLNDSCTETVFYMTWGRENGDASNCAFYPPVCSYAGMQQRLRDSYMQMGAANHASVSPVGVAWERVRTEYPAIGLYQADESHPSIYGTYLAACVFYSTLYHKTSVGSGYVIPGISAADALTLQVIASETVLDSIAVWQDAGDIPNAGFTFSVAGGNVQFINTSLNATSYSWDFGDGNISTASDPLHTYAVAGNYAVTLVASDACRAFAVTGSVHVVSTGIDENAFGTTEIYPNPASRMIVVKTNIHDYTLLIADIAGKTIVQKTDCLPAETVDISALDAGLYFVTLQKGSSVINQKLIIAH